MKNCRAATLDPEQGRYICSVTGDQCLLLIPDEQYCYDKYQDGPLAFDEESAKQQEGASNVDREMMEAAERFSYFYCEWSCKYLDLKKHRCKKFNAPLAYAKVPGGLSFTSHERYDQCKIRIDVVGSKEEDE